MAAYVWDIETFDAGDGYNNKIALVDESGSTSSVMVYNSDGTLNCSTEIKMGTSIAIADLDITMLLTQREIGSVRPL